MTLLKDKQALIFVPKHNAEGKKDVTGAFRPEAERFARLFADDRIIDIDNKRSMSGRRRQVNDVFDRLIEEGLRFDTVAVLCHGWRDGIQIGYTSAMVNQLAERIAAITKPTVEVVVPLFCCSTGADPQDDSLTAAGTGDDSFADKLRDALCELGEVHCRVMAHTTVAHTTSNPMVLFMDGMGTPDGGVGGYPPVSPKSKNWGAWKKALRDRKNSTLRFRMPYMAAAEIHEELRGGQA